jgi:Domain of Unknown Function (DUF1080)
MCNRAGSRIVEGFCALMLLISVTLPLAAQNANRIPRHGKLTPLFNGKDLTGFDTFLEKHGLNNDPEKVFQVDNGMLHISGAEFGGLATQKQYENYYLRAEFKWGEKMWPPRLGKARDSGIQYHIADPVEGSPRMLEFQVSEGGTGDIWVIRGAALTVRGQRFESTPEKGPNQGIRIPRNDRGPLQNVTGFRQPVGEVERPHGQWNVLELISDQDRVFQFVNGKLVNTGTNGNTTRGKIDFQSEFAEVYFRNMKIAPLK